MMLFKKYFSFAYSYGVHLFGMRFAACNDNDISIRKECIGIYR